MQRQIGGGKIGVYSKVENNMSDTYPYNVTSGLAKYEYEESYHNMLMVTYIEKEENVNKNNLINLGAIKPISGNATKRLRM